MTRRLLTAALCATTLGALAGCGASDEEQVSDTVDEFVEATDAADYAKICELYSDQVREQQGKNCAAALANRGRPQADVSVIDVRVRDEIATADLGVSVAGEPPGQVSLRLEKIDGDWRITSAL